MRINFGLKNYLRLLDSFFLNFFPFLFIPGTHSPEVPHPIIFRGAVFADNARFDRCVDLWLHALQLRQLNDISVVKDLLRFAQVISLGERR